MKIIIDVFILISFHGFAIEYLLTGYYDSPRKLESWHSRWPLIPWPTREDGLYALL